MISRESLALAAGARAPSEPGGRPRFGLRFEGGRGVIALARPLALGGGVGVVSALEADLGRLPSPIDLRAGASRFRHRRARALSAEVRIDLDALARELSPEGTELRVLGGAGEGAIAISVRDAVRTIAADLVPAWDVDDLSIAVVGARAAVDGPRTPTGDVIAALERAGAVLDRELGVLRLGDVLWRALAEALVPHGWRVPVLRGLGRGAPRVEGRALVLRAGAAEPIGARARQAFEQARALAAVYAAMAGDGDALRIARELAARMPRTIELEAIQGELALHAGHELDATAREPGDARTEALRLRGSLARRDVEAAAAHARRLAEVERCDDLAIEALRAASALASAEDPAVAADLAARALARRPREAELALEWLERAARAPDADTLVGGVRGLRATIAGPQRGDVLRAAAALLGRAGEHGEARRAWEEASALAPEDPGALEGLAGALDAIGRHDEALAAWDRAVALHREADGAARALLAAAELAGRSGHTAGAAARLEAASARASSDELRAEALARLAAIRRAAGARDAAVEAESELFGIAERVTSTFVVDGLFAAARAAIAEQADARARGAIGALRRSGAPSEPVRALERELEAIELDALEREAPEDSESDPAERALRARAIAERLRAAGRLGDAARALARAGAITRDAATLRAALELADKAGATDAALEVIERALEVVGSGPARAALERRRDEIRARTS